MKVVFISLAILLSTFVSLTSKASSVETYTFSKPEYEVRFHELNKILRCPKCQNQNLADSNSLISQDLRREVKRLLEEGRNDEQIMEYMVMRYGSFVLYKPKLDKVTYFLWYGPIGFGLFGLVLLVYVVMKQKKRRVQQQEKTQGITAGNESSLSDEEQAEIDKLLK